MYKNFHYYILDHVSDTIIGQFYAKSERMALKMMEGFDFNKANISPSDISLVYFNCPFDCFETYDEIMGCHDFTRVSLIEDPIDFGVEQHDA